MLISLTVADVATWADELDRVAERLLPFFPRREPRERAVADIRVLLGEAQRKNGWQLAEQIGDATPDGVQHLPLSTMFRMRKCLRCP